MTSGTKKHAPSNKWDMQMESVEVDLRRAIIGGCVSAVIILLGSWLVGRASGSEAFRLLQNALPSIRSFCGTISLALGNILALMLTLLSLSTNMDVNIKWSHYQRVRQISWLVAVTLITAIIIYLLLNIPISESNSAKMEWFIYIYYGLLAISAILGGAFITIVLLLYNTVRDMIGVMNPEARYGMQHREEE